MIKVTPNQLRRLKYIVRKGRVGRNIGNFEEMRIGLRDRTKKRAR